MEIAPFRALRYDPAAVGSLSRVVSLPFDQFDDRGRDARYRRHPLHVVRLIRPRPQGDGDPGDEGSAPPGSGAGQAAAHRHARDALRRWLAEGILRRDREAAVYPYRQRYAVPGDGGIRERWALIARVALAPLEEGPIRPHERTFPGTVEERRCLRQAVGADLGLVLVLAEDPDGALAGLLPEAAAEVPLATAIDESGTVNTIWRWCDAGRLAGLRQLLGPAAGIIADGHHRYTAALRHWQDRGGEPRDPAGWTMAALVSQRQPGLTILPIHRLVRRRVEPERLARAGDGAFGLERLASGADVEAALRAARQGLRRGARDHAVVVAARQGAGLALHLLWAPRGRLRRASWPPSVPTVWRQLDVAALHALVLEPVLGLSWRAQRHDSGELAFATDALDALRRVAAGQVAAAFLLNPLGLDEVREVVVAGEVLPPKSTNFYPKAISGLTLHAFGTGG